MYTPKFEIQCAFSKTLCVFLQISTLSGTLVMYGKGKWKIKMELYLKGLLNITCIKFAKLWYDKHFMA